MKTVDRCFKRLYFLSNVLTDNICDLVDVCNAKLDVYKVEVNFYETLDSKIPYEFNRFINYMKNYCAKSLNTSSTNVFSATYEINENYKKVVDNLCLIRRSIEQYNLGFEHMLERLQEAQDFLDEAIENYNERFLVADASRKLLTSQDLLGGHI